MLYIGSMIKIIIIITSTTLKREVVFPCYHGIMHYFVNNKIYKWHKNPLPICKHMRFSYEEYLLIKQRESRKRNLIQQHYMLLVYTFMVNDWCKDSFQS